MVMIKFRELSDNDRRSLINAAKLALRKARTHRVLMAWEAVSLRTNGLGAGWLSSRHLHHFARPQDDQTR